MKVAFIGQVNIPLNVSTPKKKKREKPQLSTAR